MTTAERRVLQQMMAASGIVLQGKDWPRKATYYKPDGEAMPNLPADPGSMQRYLDRGYTLAPPKPQVVEVAQASVPVAILESVAAQKPVERNPLECQCGFISKSPFGLQAHQRKHGKEKS